MLTADLQRNKFVTVITLQIRELWFLGQFMREMLAPWYMSSRVPKRMARKIDQTKNSISTLDGGWVDEGWAEKIIRQPHRNLTKSV